MSFKHRFFAVFMLVIIIMVFIAGCGTNTSSGNVSEIVVKSVGETTTSSSAKTVTLGPVIDPDGLNGEFNGSTPASPPPAGAVTWHRTLYLKATFLDEFGNEITVPNPSEITWTSDFPSGDIESNTGVYFTVLPSNPGVYNVNCFYEDLSAINKVVVSRRLFTGDQDYYNCKLKLSTYDENSSNPDITFNYDGVNKRYTLNALNGIKIINSQTSTYLDPGIRQDFARVAEVPSISSYDTQIIIPEDTSVICIARDASGGYAKILFSQGVLIGLDSYMEYSTTNIFEWHF